MRLAKWLDREGLITESIGNFGPALRLFGLERFRHGQLPIVLAALSGKSILVVSPTGSGKTLCFQLPALLRRGVALVVSPLKALMAEQVSDLLGKKIPATFINSDLGTDEKDLRYSLLTRQAPAPSGRQLLRGDEAIDPEDVAVQVRDAVLEGRFYVITHPESIPEIEARFDRIVGGDDPIEPA